MANREQLSFILKREIVQRLARFETPTQVAKAIKTEHGLELSLPRIHFYDPTSKNGAALSEELKDLFFESRKVAISEVEGIGGAHAAIRMRRLDRMAIAAEEKGNFVLAAALNKQLAEERGEVFTNRHKLEHTGKDGKDLPAGTATVTIIQLPDNGRN